MADKVMGKMPNSQKSSARRKRWVVISMAVLLVVGLASIAIVKTVGGNKAPPPIVVRVDDIQDFAFEEAQLFLLNESLASHIPLSLAVIAGNFGNDSAVVQAVKSAVASGSEVAAHGWNHEDLAKYSFEEQAALLSKSKSRIEEILGFEARVLVPPMYSFNNEDTVAAMEEEGYGVISTVARLPEPRSTSKVTSLPATVELSDYSNGTWKMKSLESIKSEIALSVQKYGFAVIVTHPQEFSFDGELDQSGAQLYRALLKMLKEHYSLTTLEPLAAALRQN